MSKIVEMDIKNTNRIEFIDYLNVFCCISVIALHCNGCFWKFSYERYWITSVFIESIFYFAVPVFFMITGANLIDYRDKYDTKTFFRKRFLKIFVPFLFWSIVGIVITKQFRGKDIVDILNIIINAKAIGVYWFFIPLFATYLCIPVLGSIDVSKRKAIFTYMVCLAVLCVAILPLISRLYGFNYNTGLTPPVVSGYILYVLLGYMLVKYWKLDFKQRAFIYIVGVVGLLIRLLTVLFWSLEEGKIVNVMGGYTALPTVAYSTAVFVFFQYDLKKFVSNDLLKSVDFIKLSSYSFGVYLLHMGFVKYLPKLLLFSSYSIWWRTIGVLCVYVVCVISVLVLKKIPLLKKVI